MLVVCSIIISYNHFFGTVNIQGKVLSYSKTKYLADFSEVANKRGYDGNYSTVLVDKDDCVSVKKGKK